MFKTLLEKFLKIFKSEDRVYVIPLDEGIRSSNSESSIIDGPIKQLMDNQQIVKDQTFFARKNSLAEMFWDEPPKQYVGGVDGETKLFYGEGDKRNTYDPHAKRTVEREIEFTDPETGDKIYLEETYEVSGDTMVEKPDTGDDIEPPQPQTELEKELAKKFADSIKNTANFTDFTKPKSDE